MDKTILQCQIDRDDEPKDKVELVPPGKRIFARVSGGRALALNSCVRQDPSALSKTP